MLNATIRSTANRYVLAMSTLGWLCCCSAFVSLLRLSVIKLCLHFKWAVTGTPVISKTCACTPGGTSTVAKGFLIRSKKWFLCRFWVSRLWHLNTNNKKAQENGWFVICISLCQCNKYTVEIVTLGIKRWNLGWIFSSLNVNKWSLV